MQPAVIAKTIKQTRPASAAATIFSKDEYVKRDRLFDVAHFDHDMIAAINLDTHAPK